MLELQNISYIVDDEGKDKDILKDVSLKLDDDKFFVITGPNGGGKSSLAKIIAGIYKPTSGKIIYNGTDITDMSMQRHISYDINGAATDTTYICILSFPEGSEPDIDLIKHWLTNRTGASNIQILIK